MSSLDLVPLLFLSSLVGSLLLQCCVSGPGTLWKVSKGVSVGGFVGRMCSLVVLFLSLSTCVVGWYGGGYPICLYHVLDAEVV